jgi:glycosyltransferase involved in cell wall biosynthesis
MTIPLIQAVNSAGERPLWSVMIPTYRSDIRMLREAISGPLASAVDRTKMQIALVDDASGLNWQNAPWNAFAQECRDLGIEIHLFETNLGLAGNWNRCLNLSRGHFVHLLHQDDRVHSTFYDAISAGFQADAKIGAVFTQHTFIDGEGNRLRSGHLKSPTAGVLDTWLEYVFANLAILCPAIVVRRPVYERLGGFDASYRYCCDREMWQRIAMEYPLWFDPRPLSDYRLHNKNASIDLVRRSYSWLELKRCATEGAKRISPPVRQAAMRSFRRHTLTMAMVAARQATRDRDWLGAFAIVKGAASIARPSAIYALKYRRYARTLFSRPPDRPPDPAAQRSPRILLLSMFFPWDPERSVFGAFQRLRRHVLALDSLGPVDVVFFSPGDKELSQGDIAARTAIARRAWPLRGSVHFVTTGGPKRFCDRVSDAFWMLRGFVGFSGDDAPNMRTCRRSQIESLRQILRLSQPDLIFTHRLSTAVPLLRIKSQLPPIVVDFDDLDSVRLERSEMSKPHLAGKWKARFGVLLAQRAQRRVSAMASSVIVCSELEQHKVQSMCPRAHVVTVPNTAAVLGELPPNSQPVAVFVGTAVYRPNREAIMWFSNDIWPHVRRALPDARLVVVGEKTDELGIASPQLGIEALGFVQNLAPIYAAAMLAVCPVRRGSGTRIKIIEASINGRPVVSTTVGAEGLVFIPGTEILLEDDARGFADACIRLFRDPALAALIGKAASQRALSTYQKAQINERLRAICTEALHGDCVARPNPNKELTVMPVIEIGERA